MEEKLVRSSQLAGDLVAQTEGGADLNLQKETLSEIRRELEAVHAQIIRLTVQLNQTS